MAMSKSHPSILTHYMDSATEIIHDPLPIQKAGEKAIFKKCVKHISVPLVIVYLMYQSEIVLTFLTEKDGYKAIGKIEAITQWGDTVTTVECKWQKVKPHVKVVIRKAHEGPAIEEGEVETDPPSSPYMHEPRFTALARESLRKEMGKEVATIVSTQHRFDTQNIVDRDGDKKPPKLSPFSGGHFRVQGEVSYEQWRYDISHL